MAKHRELGYAGVTILLVGVIFITWTERFGVPESSGFLGHMIGVIGFVLMLATETLYSLRKRAVRRPIGRMSSWLQVHIYMGLVGPFLVFLHAAWSFRGLAGIVLLLTAIVVLSGFIGRYIYTAVPRTADGIEIEAGVLREQIAELEGLLGRYRVPVSPDLPPEAVESHWRTVIFRAPNDLWMRVRGWLDRRKVDRSSRAEQAEIDRLMRRRKSLERQMSTLRTSRRLLAIWHSVHVPLGVVLFTAAFIHIIGAFYYATLLR
jgi:hypothetical protein